MAVAQENIAVQDDWRLILVNEDNALDEDYQVDLTTLRGDYLVEERIYEDLQAMFDNARQVGIYH